MLELYFLKTISQQNKLTFKTIFKIKVGLYIKSKGKYYFRVAEGKNTICWRWLMAHAPFFFISGKPRHFPRSAPTPSSNGYPPDVTVPTSVLLKVFTLLNWA